ncbi:MAG: phosphopantetheine-binding protein [Rickettsiales bacterium]
MLNIEEIILNNHNIENIRNNLDNKIQNESNKEYNSQNIIQDKLNYKSNINNNMQNELENDTKIEIDKNKLLLNDSINLNSNLETLNKQNENNNIELKIENQENNHIVKLKIIEEKIINIVSEFIKIENININFNSIVIKNLKDFGLDSIDITEIIMSVEEEFDVHFTEQDYDKLSNIQDIAKFILNNQILKD